MTSLDSEIDEIIANAMAECSAHSGSPITEYTTPPSQDEHPEDPIIPENSKSILVDESTSRFSDAIWYNKIQEKEIILAGVGGIGSYCAFLLSRMKPRRIIMFDDDIVDATNMSGQFYSSRDIGRYKVSTMYDKMAEYSNYRDILAYDCRYDENQQASDIMICGFDNMEARKTCFHNWLMHVNESSNPENCLFIDGRLAAEEFQVFAIQGNDSRAIKEYEEKWLFSDDQADETICSYKQTSFCANMIASVMTNLFVNFVANQCDPIIPRDVPFLTEYNASTMFFKVIS